MTIQRKRCKFCRQSRPTYLIASHEEQCEKITERLQRERQQELLAELKKLQN